MTEIAEHPVRVECIDDFVRSFALSAAMAGRAIRTEGRSIACSADIRMESGRFSPGSEDPYVSILSASGCGFDAGVGSGSSAEVELYRGGEDRTSWRAQLFAGDVSSSDIVRGLGVPDRAGELPGGSPSVSGVMLSMTRDVIATSSQVAAASRWELWDSVDTDASRLWVASGGLARVVAGVVDEVGVAMSWNGNAKRKSIGQITVDYSPPDAFTAMGDDNRQQEIRFATYDPKRAQWIDFELLLSHFRSSGNEYVSSVYCMLEKVTSKNSKVVQKWLSQHSGEAVLNTRNTVGTKLKGTSRETVFDPETTILTMARTAVRATGLSAFKRRRFLRTHDA